MYVIVDIESTGSVSTKDRITEIAIYKHDGKQIVDEFVTLVNPQIRIPKFVSKLTGITNRMVEDAPLFHEVAKKIVEITEGCTFVAHNSNFDYNFLKAEFKALGYNFYRNSLCTVDLSRKLIPGMQSYSLGKLSKELGIELNGRHRAGGDALATVKIFELILKNNYDDIVESMLKIDTYSKEYHANIPQESIENLEDQTGVYYMHDKDGKVLYVGKSKNIRARVMSHFNGSGSKLSQYLKKEVFDISYEITGSELIALLLESEEIKKYQPIYNSGQKKSKFKMGLYDYTDRDGYIRFHISEILPEHGEPFTKLYSKKHGIGIVESAVKKFSLCAKKAGLSNEKGACFQYSVNECNGACIAEEKPEEYNQRAMRAITWLQLGHDSLFIIDKGRDLMERSVVQVNKGKYIGFGYIDISEGVNSKKALEAVITEYPEHKDSKKILSQFIRSRKMEKIIRY
ncbi:exonuclease domain-containing protein [Flammeovirgaceae bacterium SG7u.111]|nr:exonuclease domain-containing protein [Flammeovirgaceae bacterium SG7u.132]WPO36362.1 exonuclease domain-containing protein [Flammeovirgaceae bacterium SG7u.111]